ncbi:MAG: AI-2E family transporter [Caldilineaceae bacterium]|nr:AI-2E family transporter [Caldilineaceae bacterium]
MTSAVGEGGVTDGETTAGETIAPGVYPVAKAQAVSAAPIPRAPLDGSTWDIPTKRTVLVILLVATVFVFWISRPVIPLIVLAAIIAYLLNPIVDMFQRLRIPRSITTILLFLFVLVAIFLAPLLLGPVLLRAAHLAQLRCSYHCPPASAMADDHHQQPARNDSGSWL